MSRIENLKSEIEAIQSQLSQLRHERSQLEHSLPVFTGGELSEIAIAVKATAVTVAERKTQLTEVSNAITLLERRLPPLQAELSAQQKEQDKRSLNPLLSNYSN